MTFRSGYSFFSNAVLIFPKFLEKKEKKKKGSVSGNIYIGPFILEYCEVCQSNFEQYCYARYIKICQIENN